jgi:hypothetical protein
MLLPASRRLFARRANLPRPAAVDPHPKSVASLPSSRPDKRGVSRSSQTLGRDAVDAAASCARGDRRAGDEPVSDHQASGREMLQRTAKSCGPDAPTLASSSRSCVGPTGLRQNISADDGGKRARSPRRARRNPLKPLRAECRVFPVYSLLLVCVLPLSLHTRPRVHWASGIPHALFGREI